jgi:hypothetical protein
MTDTQAALFEFAPVTYQTEWSLEDRFWHFHWANPWVYDELVRLARIAKEHGRNRIAIASLVERLRWDFELRASTGEEWKVNNSYRAFYARLIMRKESDLAEMFEVRAQRCR